MSSDSRFSRKERWETHEQLVSSDAQPWVKPPWLEDEVGRSTESDTVHGQRAIENEGRSSPDTVDTDTVVTVLVRRASGSSNTAEVGTAFELLSADRVDGGHSVTLDTCQVTSECDCQSTYL